MAIRVIEHGKKKFTTTCPNCGCRFEYELEDIKSEFAGVKTVKCPDCQQECYHYDYTIYPYWPPQPTYPVNPCVPTPNIPSVPSDPITKPNVIWSTPVTAPSNWPDCATCPNRPDPNKPATVGDTPCTWCIKNRPYCGGTTGITGVTGTSAKFTFPKEMYTATGQCPEAYLKGTTTTGYTGKKADK